jgi:hypothetical protein
MPLDCISPSKVTAPSKLLDRLVCGERFRLKIEVSV